MSAQHIDHKAFTQLYRAHYRSVVSYARLSVPASEVDDVVAESFLVAWRRFSDVPADWTRAWLLGVTRNVARTRNRAARRSTDFVRQLFASQRIDQAGPAQNDEAIEQLDVLRASLAKLSPSDQEILVLAGPYAMTPVELAVALDVSTNAATVRLHRARRRLRHVYAELTDDGAAA